MRRAATAGGNCPAAGAGIPAAAPPRRVETPLLGHVSKVVVDVCGCLNDEDVGVVEGILVFLAAEAGGETLTLGRLRHVTGFFQGTVQRWSHGEPLWLCPGPEGAGDAQHQVVAEDRLALAVVGIGGNRAKGHASSLGVSLLGRGFSTKIGLCERSTCWEGLYSLMFERG